MARLIVPRFTPVDVLDGIHVTTSSSFSQVFEFDGPVTEIVVQGGPLVGGDPLNRPDYAVAECLNGTTWSNLGNDTWLTIGTYSTLGLGVFRVSVLNTPYNGNIDWHLTVLGR